MNPTTKENFLEIAEAVKNGFKIQILVPNYGWCDVKEDCYDFDFMRYEYRTTGERL